MHSVLVKTVQQRALCASRKWSTAHSGTFALRIALLFTKDKRQTVDNATVCVYLIAFPFLRSYWWRWRQYVSPKRRCLSGSPHGVITQETNINTFTAVRTSNVIMSWNISPCISNQHHRKIIISGAQFAFPQPSCRRSEPLTVKKCCKRRL
jgi:hypothetical protein